ncbi:hypothetical protein OHD62_19210 [Mesorhizobium sp. YC-39]|uniref:hypothetical protein n=1 Tax=unclassified Mesorhizobium TaxID=325217 RepID=UPI0021E85DB6|nr:MULTISPECIES: hypothetical protein [unclassified Mesorhizobium]MCV3209973.1 hypothetical protein [Mesorhizobium sp. YC-2]MCV3230503.1 hypothetical protein [Mesorhizobium sp. YC-39]
MPNQIALPDDICTDRNFPLINRFLTERGLTCRTRAVIAVWEDGKHEQWRLHCFGDPAAAAFLARFGLRQAGDGRTRGVWRRQGACEHILELGPLSVPEILRN